MRQLDRGARTSDPTCEEARGEAGSADLVPMGARPAGTLRGPT